MLLENKIAIITGGARGIGKAIAKLYAKEGSNIVIADIDFEEAKKYRICKETYKPRKENASID